VAGSQAYARKFPDTEPDKTKPDKKSQDSDKKEESPPVPALLVLAPEGEIVSDRLLDLARSRVDSVELLPDRRRWKQHYQ
jgi:hypothetical protein